MSTDLAESYRSPPLYPVSIELNVEKYSPAKDHLPFKLWTNFSEVLVNGIDCILYAELNTFIEPTPREADNPSA
jgi:hypothetical protein